MALRPFFSIGPTRYRYKTSAILGPRASGSVVGEMVVVTVSSCLRWKQSMYSERGAMSIRREAFRGGSEWEACTRTWARRPRWFPCPSDHANTDLDRCSWSAPRLFRLFMRVRRVRITRRKAPDSLIEPSVRKRYVGSSQVFYLR